MKVIRVNEPGGPEKLQLEELPTPEPGEGELLVRLEAIGVNYTDVQLRLGSHGSPMPVTPGREGAGETRARWAGCHVAKPDLHEALRDIADHWNVATTIDVCQVNALLVRLCREQSLARI